jgi:hypothetical protein
MERVESVSALVERLGGPAAAGKILGTTPQNVIHWRTGGAITARFFAVHKSRLAVLGIDVGLELYDFATEADLSKPPRRQRVGRRRRPRSEAARAGDPPP